MTCLSVPFRVSLALIIGLWAPLSCCCAAPAPAAPAQAAIDTAACHAEPAVPSCHHEAPPADAQSPPRHPCDGEGDCDCPSHVAQARVSPDEPVAPLIPDAASFLLDFPPGSPRLFDAAPALGGFVLHETGPPPRPDTSLLALHCMLTI